MLADRNLPVFVGVDASVKRDSPAIVGCAFDPDKKKVRLIFHRIFQPTPDGPLDFESTVEASLRDQAPILGREVRYDPYQMHATAQR